MKRPAGKVPRWWLPSVAATSATALAALGVLVVEISGPHHPEGRQAPQEPLHERDGAVHLAGSGTCLPLARALAAGYRRAHPEEPPAFVHASIGSGGGLRALAAGVTDVAMASSPEGDLRRAPAGYNMVPIALAAVAVAVHPSVPDRELTVEGAAGALSGQRRAWSDGGIVVPLLREVGDSATAAATEALPELGPALQQARREGRFRTLITDLEMGNAIEGTPGGIGLYDAGAIQLERRSIEVVSVQGTLPTREALVSRRYPIRRVLLFALSQSPRPEGARFMEYVLSEGGRAIIDGAGYVALDGEAP